MLVNFLKKYKYSLLMMSIILLVLYPLSLFIYVPKWDNINGYLPYRYFISDYLWNGHLPFWNSFQRLGYPGYADLQSGAWNPIVLGLMLFGKYTINSLIIELLSCYVFAGLGMMKLSNYLFNCKKTAFIIGLSYSLSGFMVGSSQLMVFLIAVTWFPWVIYCLFKFFEVFSLKYQLLTAFFIALFITGASPAYTIILAYIVVGIFIYHLITQKVFIKKIMIGGIVILSSIILLTLPYINAFLEFVPYFNRADGLEYDRFLLANPFTPISYISFLLPDAVIAKTDWFNITDLSLRNGYFGLIGVFGLISSFLSKFNRFKLVLTICLFLSLLLAAGGETFVFEFLYHLPGFGIFRHPSMFRAFTIFCALLLAGYEIKNLLNNGLQKKHKLILFSLFGLFVLSFAWSLTKTSIKDVGILLSNVIDFVEFSESKLSTHILLNSIISILLIGFLIFLYRKSPWISLLLFLIFDFAIHTRISTPTTVCYKFSHSDFSNFFDNLPEDINQSNNYTPFKNLDESQQLVKTDGIWQNVSTFNKSISYVGVNPMRFKEFDKALDDGRLEEAISHNIIYYENSGKPPKNINIGYNKFSAEVNADIKETIVLNQNYHHLWNASINDKKLIIQPHHDLAMKVEIPASTTGKVIFEYKSPRTIYAIIISLIGYAFVLFYLIKNRYKSNA